MDDIRSQDGWEKIKKKMMEKYPALTEEDFEEEDEKKLLIHLGERIGETAADTRFIIKNL